jgi:hypothetical protein
MFYCQLKQLLLLTLYYYLELIFSLKQLSECCHADMSH